MISKHCYNNGTTKGINNRSNRSQREIDCENDWMLISRCSNHITTKKEKLENITVNKRSHAEVTPMIKEAIKFETFQENFLAILGNFIKQRKKKVVNNKLYQI